MSDGAHPSYSTWSGAHDVCQYYVPASCEGDVRCKGQLASFHTRHQSDILEKALSESDSDYG